MKLMKITTTLSMATAAMLMLLGTQGATKAQSVGVLGGQQLAPSVKLTIKANGWLDNGTAQGSEYFGTASWNCSASFKQLVFSTDADGTEHVDALAYGTFYDTVNYIISKANVASHFIKHIDGTNETRVTITNAKTNAVLYTNEPTAQSVPLMLPGGLMSVEMPQPVQQPL